MKPDGAAPTDSNFEFTFWTDGELLPFSHRIHARWFVNNPRATETMYLVYLCGACFGSVYICMCVVFACEALCKNKKGGSAPKEEKEGDNNLVDAKVKDGHAPEKE